MAKKHCNTNPVVPTFDYLRKSTKGEVEANGKKRQRQEKSIEQQRTELDNLPFPREIEDAGYGGIKVVGTFEDEGVSGWKLGDKRPGFQKMINAIKKHDAKQKAIRVDDIDRFSRATLDDTQEVVRELKKAGVRWIVTAAQGVFDLGKDANDLMANMKVAFAAWSSHEYSRKLGRRIALARRNKAVEGKRSGCSAPYGMKDDGKGGLMPGKPDEVAVVRQMFHWFVKEHKSLRWITNQLNLKSIPSAQGKLWYVPTVKAMLENPAYGGIFTYGRRRAGQFYQVASDGEVIEAPAKVKQVVHEPVIIREGAFEGIIDPKLFKAAQKRFESFKTGRKPRNDGFTLTGILRCDHCGGPLYGVTINGGTIVYRCNTSIRQGKDSCKQYQIRQDEILPGIMEMLNEEIDTLAAQSLVSHPPKENLAPGREAKIEALKKRIEQWEDRILDIENKKTRQSLDQKIAVMRDELNQLMTEQDKDQSDDAELAAMLKEWWVSFEKQAVSVSLDPKSKIAQTTYPDTAAFVSAWGDESFMAKIDRRAINEVLHGLGCEVRLRWRTEPRGQRCRHVLEKGRFRLGQRVGTLACCVLHSERPLIW